MVWAIHNPPIKEKKYTMMQIQFFDTKIRNSVSLFKMNQKKNSIYNIKECN